MSGVVRADRITPRSTRYAALASGNGPRGMAAGKRPRSRGGLGARRDRRRPEAQGDAHGDTRNEEAHAFEIPRITSPSRLLNFAIRPRKRGGRGQDLTRLSRMRRRIDRPPQFEPENQAAADPGVGSMPVEMTSSHEAQYNGGRHAVAAAHSLQGEVEGLVAEGRVSTRADGRPRQGTRHVACEWSRDARRRLRVRGRQSYGGDVALPSKRDNLEYLKICYES